jgi:hypothetical protein
MLEIVRNAHPGRAEICSSLSERKRQTAEFGQQLIDICVLVTLATAIV